MNKMKTIAATVLSLVAMSAFAVEAPTSRQVFEGDLLSIKETKVAFQSEGRVIWVSKGSMNACERSYIEDVAGLGDSFEISEIQSGGKATYTVKRIGQPNDQAIETRAAYKQWEKACAGFPGDEPAEEVSFDASRIESVFRDPNGQLRARIKSADVSFDANRIESVYRDHRGQLRAKLKPAT